MFRAKSNSVCAGFCRCFRALTATSCGIQIPNRFSRYTIATILLFLSALITQTRADEYSLIRTSSVIGRNFGIPPVIDLSTDQEIGDLNLVVESLFFGKNLELTGSPNIDGETFLGVLAPIRFHYVASDQLQIEMGAYVGRNYGDDDSLDISEPLARAIYQTAPGQYAIFGSLIQTHWAHDALRDDIDIYRGSETGLQYRVNLDWFKSDWWIDWRTRETKSTPEVFDGAGTNQFRIGRLWIDAQFFWTHFGGQKNSSGVVSNNSTAMLGLSYGSLSDFDQQIGFRIGSSFLVSNFESRTAPTSTGNGVEYWVNVDIPMDVDQTARIFAKHFQGDNYFSLRGDPLYQFDSYTQCGFDWVKTIMPNTELELGFVAQLADGAFMNTFQVNLVWQNGFRLQNFQPQSGRPFLSNAAIEPSQPFDETTPLTNESEAVIQ